MLLPLNVNTIPFNAHQPSWFSRKGADDRAEARGEALDGAINSLQLAVTNQDLPTRLPSQGQHYSPDITFLSRHLLPDVMWSTLTTLGSDHLPITVTHSSHAPTGHGKCVLLQTSARPNGRHSQKSQRGTSLRHHCQPPALLKEKSSGVFSATPEDTISPHPLRLCSRLLQPSPRCCATPHHRERERSAPHWRPPWHCHHAAGPGCTGLNVMHLCTCLSCKPRPLHVRACWCHERVCHASAVKGFVFFCMFFGLFFLGYFRLG